MSYWYLASPYSHEDKRVVEYRVGETERALVWLNLQGWTVYSPIVHWHRVAVKYRLSTDSNYWWRTNRVMLISCLGIIRLEIDGWQESKGMKQEEEFIEAFEKKSALHRMREDAHGGWTLSP